MFYSIDILRKNIVDNIVESKFSKAKLLGQEIMTTKGQPAHVYGQDSRRQISLTITAVVKVIRIWLYE